jgi:predicted alpha/beta hydrolase family esterase
MKILFLHGLESKPGGTKARFLKEAGYEVVNPALPRDSFDTSVKIAQDIIDVETPDVVIGSSRGGAVGMSINACGASVVLIAPAWKRFLNEQQMQTWDIRCDAQRTIVLHSRSDDVVPFEDSESLSQRNGVKVLEIGENHRMSDEDALSALLDVVQWLSSKRQTKS